jgi:dihydropteroate synthase
MQGVQIHRVHDIDAMRQALDMVAALTVQRGWHPDQKGREMP